MEGSSAHRSKRTNAMTMSNRIALGKELEELLRRELRRCPSLSPSSDRTG